MFSAVSATNAALGPYPEALRLLTREGVLSGYPDGNFRPEQVVTRAELVTVVMRGQEREHGASGACFADVKATAWYHEAVCGAKAEGRISGFDNGTFRPGQRVSFAAALKLLLGNENVGEGAKAPWYAPYLERAADLGLSPVLEAEAHLTRGDLVLLLYTLRQDRALQRGLPLPSSGCGKRATPLASFELRGAARGLITALPDGYDGRTPRKLVFGFHGRTSPNSQVRRYYGLEPHAQDTIFVYPEALRSGSGFSWSRGVGPDLELFDTLLDTLAQTYCVDLARVYVVGHSLGAYYANTLACERGDRVRAVASLGGGLSAGGCRGKTAAMILHNPKDRLVPFAEGEQARDQFLTSNGLVGVSPTAPASLNCVRYPARLHPVAWCPHGVDYAYNGSYYPHTWPREAGGVIMGFFDSLEASLTVERP